jgi:hypothetical protein
VQLGRNKKKVVFFSLVYFLTPRSPKLARNAEGRHFSSYGKNLFERVIETWHEIEKRMVAGVDNLVLDS